MRGIESARDVGIDAPPLDVTFFRARVASSLGWCLLAQARGAEAEPLLRDAHATLASHRPDHWFTAETHERLTILERGLVTERERVGDGR